MVGYASTLEIPADSWFPHSNYEVKGLWNRFTFDTWKIGYSSEVINIPIDKDYMSDYMLKYGILRETGWVFDKGWINPRTGRVYKAIDSAYSSQKLWEATEGSK